MSNINTYPLYDEVGKQLNKVDLMYDLTYNAVDYRSKSINTTYKLATTPYDNNSAWNNGPSQLTLSAKPVATNISKSEVAKMISSVQSQMIQAAKEAAVSNFNKLTSGISSQVINLENELKANKAAINKISEATSSNAMVMQNITSSLQAMEERAFAQRQEDKAATERSLALQEQRHSEQMMLMINALNLIKESNGNTNNQQGNGGQG